jgi:hypothetical protein
VKRAVRSLDYSACQRLAEEALGLPDGESILAKSESLAREHYGELL